MTPCSELKMAPMGSANVVASRLMSGDSRRCRARSMMLNARQLLKHLRERTGRKAFALAGYGFSTAAKTILLVANSVAALSLFRVIERLGKSFRGAPRDAWLSTIAANEVRGYSFGVHKALDKAGAVVGPLIAFA